MLPKFLIYVDYLSTNSIPSEYIELPAKKLEDAILAAENIFDSGKHYLVSVMSKTSPVTKQNDIKSVEYTAQMPTAKAAVHDGGILNGLDIILLCNGGSL